MYFRINVLQNISRPVGINTAVEEIMHFKGDDLLDTESDRRGFLSLLSFMMSEETPPVYEEV
jgi:hypothetical protein